mgnify:CR=1 FL=1
MHLCAECGVNPVTKPGGECADCKRQEEEAKAADLASAQEWARGRLARAKQLGDGEIVQHLGNLLAASEAAPLADRI